MKTHRNLTPRQEVLAERNLCTAVAALQTPDECRAFFRDLCTPAELQAMADRWAVVEWLQRGVPYREIHRQTGVSVTTIGRVARFLGAGNGGYVIAARRLDETKRRQTARRSGTVEPQSARDPGRDHDEDAAANQSESGKRAASSKRADSARRPEATRHG